jgi:serine/threonine protein kinase
MSPTEHSEPKLINGRYALTNDAPRQGGMSIVRKAFDLQESRFCAIKRMKGHEQDLRWKDSFHREYSALTDLSGHPNIVSLYDAGSDDQGFFMVLEWVPDNLVDWVGSRGRFDWAQFYQLLGRPLLDALAFAQNRRWHHRDIKPQNILVDEKGVPKISDYGIARHLDSPKLGVTFGSFRSEPFTPPENDSGPWIGSRDCFSWAALAVYCLTGSIPKDYGDLTEAAAGFDRDIVPVSLLLQALSAKPEERPPLASAMFADFEAHWEQYKLHAAEIKRVHLQFDAETLRRLLRAIDGADRADAEQYVLHELNELDVGLRYVAGTDPSETLIRVFAVTWIFELARSQQRDRLVVRRAFQSKAGEVERYRDNAYRAPLEFAFGEPADAAASSFIIDEVFLQAEAYEVEARDKLLLAQRERIFRTWYAFLRAKADFEARRENAVPFVDRSVGERSVSLTTELPAPIEIVGQSRLIKSAGGGHVFCDVIDVNLDEVVVTVTSGDAASIPRAGRLELNTIAAERAIERQRRALDAVNYNRAVSGRLRPILLDPSCGLAPSPVRNLKVSGDGFDPEKIRVLESAVGVREALAIQGPPGTGKTRLIEEIIVQYFALNPNHRLLLSSQTHVALDNVIERIHHRMSSLEIVRIGRLDDPKISAISKNLILDRKVEEWSRQVKQRAREFMSRWAEERGIDSGSIQVGMLVERLILLLQQRAKFRAAMTAANSQVRAIRQREERKLEETGSAESSDISTDSVEAEQNLASIRRGLSDADQLIGEIRERLRALGGYGVELAGQSEASELAEWPEVLLGDGEEQRQCRDLLELQEEWMLRVGSSSEFHAPMLTSAQIVAGTCIGMASVRGMGEVAYDLCIVDEASKATATEILVPMARSRKWILVGDPAQLPPFFEDNSITRLADFDETEVKETILDRFLRGLPEHSKTVLENQYRMVKAIGDLISHSFYQGKLSSPKIKPDITLPGAFPKPITWLSTSACADSREIRRGQSFYNDAECRAVREALSQIDFVARRRRATYSVALIAGYVAQVKALQDVIRGQEWTGLQIACSTVDAFQGSEAEICIYSVTRSNRDGRLGFLREKPRLNVALSRGRSVLIIVGDDDFCRSIQGENPFRTILDFFEINTVECERRLVQ